MRTSFCVWSWQRHGKPRIRCTVNFERLYLAKTRMVAPKWSYRPTIISRASRDQNLREFRVAAGTLDNTTCPSNERDAHNHGSTADHLLWYTLSGCFTVMTAAAVDCDCDLHEPHTSVTRFHCAWGDQSTDSIARQSQASTLQPRERSSRETCLRMQTICMGMVRTWRASLTHHRRTAGATSERRHRCQRSLAAASTGD